LSDDLIGALRAESGAGGRPVCNAPETVRSADLATDGRGAGAIAAAACRFTQFAAKVLSSAAAICRKGAKGE